MLAIWPSAASDRGRRPSYSVAHAGAPADIDRRRRSRSSSWRGAACWPAWSPPALMFPVVGGFGLMSNRASDVVANGSAQLVEGEVPAVSTMVDAKGNAIAWLYSQRRFEVPSDQIANTMKLAIVSIEDKRFAEHNGVDWQGTLTGLSGYLSGDVDTRGGSTIEQQYVKNYQLLVIAQTDAEKRAAVETTPGPQAARDPDGADARQDVHQAGDPHPLSEPGVVRQRRVRRAGRGADLLRHQRLRPELAAGRAAGRHGAVHQHAEPVHQPRRRAGAPKPGAGHHDREPPASRPTSCAPPRSSRWASCRSPTSCRAAASPRATARSSATTRWSTWPARASARSRSPRAAT